jgi:coproporphyrinogen III oxidase
VLCDVYKFSFIKIKKTGETMSAPNIQAVKTWLLSLQATIVAAVEAVDGKEFIKDSWERPEGGGGISRLIEEGNVLERGGVGFSHVTGSRLPP